ncbi:transcriptional regulator [Dictyobacter alpinus]|uniref:Transcriptional regulator n=1 Tax=Dictyobacter alpinus TaxID=2014873 RepID=A0A402BFE8_9CHLR|nr:YafY family protein [Dictyobacter alpinus]GCE30069.1 transcriptional regulator [Dictyobacter alpinus]
MYSPVSRLLIVLNLLQARSSITAKELAERLEVNTRSVRRYIIMLQDLGIPVETERGRYGGYRLRPGFKLPPLMWTEEEAVAVTLGLQAVKLLGSGSSQPGVASALAKVERVLPRNILEQVQAIQDMVVLQPEAASDQVSSRWVSLLSMAAYRGQRSRITYQAKDDQQTERVLDCYSVIYLQKHWYAIGYCHLRQDIRLFRLDRIRNVERCEEYFTRPNTFDALAYALQTIAAMPSRWLAEVLLETTLEQISWAVPPTFATLEERSDGILLRAYDDDLDHLARFLVHLGCPFLVMQPPELLEAMQRLGEKITAMVVQAQHYQMHHKLP